MSNTSRMMQSAAAGVPGTEWTLLSVSKPFSPLGQVYLGAAEYEQIAWKPDGSYFYVVRRAGYVNRYSGNAAWETYPRAYNQFGGQANISSQDTEMLGLAFKPDGTKMYTTGQVNSKVYEYDLSSPWNLANTSFVQDYSLGFGSDFPASIAFSPDGLNMFVSREGITDALYSYSLGTAWDLSTVSAVTSVAITDIWGIAFNASGTTLFYAAGNPFNNVKNFYSRPLSTAWDLSSLGSPTAFDDDKWYANGASSSPDTGKLTRHISFKSDGTKAFLTVADNNLLDPVGIYNYDLSTPYDLSTATRQLAAERYYDFPGLNSTTNNGKAGLCFSAKGGSFYIADSFTSTVQQYDMSVPWDIATASYAAQISSAYDQDVAISRDGTLLFAAVGTGVQTYTLSTPYDVTTATLTRTTLHTTMDGIFFREDGLKFYTCYTDVITEYTLGTAYDLSTASLENQLDTNLGGFLRSLRFDSSGTRGLALQALSFGAGYKLQQFSLATPWDVSTLSAVRSRDITVDRGGSEFNGPRGMDVSPDGRLLFAPIRGQDILVQYELD